MKIVLMADNRKTELLVNFCIAYKALLEKHQLISIYNTAKLLKASAELDVSGLSVDYSSGFEQLASRAEFDGIDCVIYLRDGRIKEGSNPGHLLDVCDQNTIPYATNIASAEVLITAIDAGALDYRQWKNEDAGDVV
ncbi:MAG: methylglyoxal synthase [Mageeibacillus sp.]|jgi:methylglyoxal synthase|nr:methylglyoxal synthase [Mageeibacillus sp.]MCI1263356.1 methylglyoxal synthase [Saccharofermentans sp.]MCI1769017.1 methylglyoxal synthase [Mageeibacillus sp.]MCI2043952.1 methylglyoxal synthase [Mageeibacillus sp.]